MDEYSEFLKLSHGHPDWETEHAHCLWYELAATFCDINTTNHVVTSLRRKRDNAVYYISVYDKNSSLALRWINPRLKEKYIIECKRQGTGLMVFWITNGEPGSVYQNIDCFAEFIELAKGILCGQSMQVVSKMSNEDFKRFYLNGEI